MAGLNGRGPTEKGLGTGKRMGRCFQKISESDSQRYPLNMRTCFRMGNKMKNGVTQDTVTHRRGNGRRLRGGM
mgnify:CR=1 FL=1